MEPGIPTSFIPKRPFDTGSVSTTRHSHTVGLLSLLTFIIVLATVVSFGFVYLYKQKLIAQKTKLEASIDETRDVVGTEFLSEMKALDSRINGVKTLIKNHVVVSPLFDALEASTLRSVQYTTFSYTTGIDPATKSPVILVDLAGTARSYATIALQSEAFSNNTLIKNPVFSTLMIDEKTRNVNFKLSFSVAPEALSYQKFIDTLSQAPKTGVRLNTTTP